MNYARVSLGIFDYQNSFRKKLVEISETNAFDRLVLILIAVDATCQALNVDKSDKPAVDIILNVTSTCFCIEAAIKIISMGLFKHRNAYLKNGWNIVDFIVVSMSLAEFLFIDVLNLSNFFPSLKALRVMRVLRPLRTIKRVKSMRGLVTVILKSLPQLGNTFLFLMFFFTMFAIIGLHTFKANIHQRCRLTEKPENDKLWRIDYT